jgi:hypothetical protein
LLLGTLYQHDFTIDRVETVYSFIKWGEPCGEQQCSVCDGVTPISFAQADQVTDALQFWIVGAI